MVKERVTAQMTNFNQSSWFKMCVIFSIFCPNTRVCSSLWWWFIMFMFMFMMMLIDWRWSDTKMVVGSVPSNDRPFLCWRVFPPSLCWFPTGAWKQWQSKKDFLLKRWEARNNPCHLSWYADRKPLVKQHEKPLRRCTPKNKLGAHD